MNMNVLNGIEKQAHEFTAARPYIEKLVITVYRDTHDGKLRSAAKAYAYDGAEIGTDMATPEVK